MVWRGTLSFWSEFPGNLPDAFILVVTRRRMIEGGEEAAKCNPFSGKMGNKLQIEGKYVRQCYEKSKHSTNRHGINRRRFTSTKFFPSDTDSPFFLFWSSKLMSISYLKRFRFRKWKLLALISILAALSAWFQFFFAVQPGNYSEEMVSREYHNHGAVVSSLNASVSNKGFDEVNVLMLKSDNASYPNRLSIGGTAMDNLSELGKMYSIQRPEKSGTEDEIALGLQDGKSKWRNESIDMEKFIRRMRGRTITFSEINSMLIKARASSSSLRRRLSARARELVAAKKQIKIARARSSNTISNSELHLSLFRNASMFQRSYELMEHTLKIYLYEEGERPIFHKPRLRGLYCAEGWFMYLLQRSKHFVVKDPRKAHLFYLPFSSESLRVTIYQQDKSPNLKKLEIQLTNYVALIKRKYKFWNTTGGADHFFVGCHDWAPRITGKVMGNCIRALCNANIARGFNIGKDVSVPVTYIRSGNNPLQDIGGNPASQRPVLTFFAGGIHGYLRPLLLRYWENKTEDMKILGPMQRDVEGKAMYRRYMKESKYCICARGYEVHTPRVVESIYYECVPVIISDNYVPPFFEVLDWEAFSVFVLEKDIPRLREILLSIPEEKYLEMQRRVINVRRHFVWNKVPQKYDLFHMILHSIWFNRLFQI
ncbi:hypothetical protein V2J09_002891 [Rumex salicifolius]